MGTNSGNTRARDGREAIAGAVFALLWDVGLPVALYYLLRHFGVGKVWALLTSGLPPALRAVAVGVRRRRLEGLGIFVLVVLAANVALALLSGSARALLIRGGWIGLVTGLWMFASLAILPRPFTYQAAVSLLPGKANELDQLWDTKASFRQLWRRLAVVWGIGALIGCALNLFYAIALPVDVVPALDSATQIAVFVLLQVLTQIAVHREGSLAELWGRRQS